MQDKNAHKNFNSALSVTIISTPPTLNAALEVWFIQNVLFSGAPCMTEFNPLNIGGDSVVYFEQYQIDRLTISKMKSEGKKVILYHMGDEKGDKDISAYSQCDLIIRNYFFPEIINNPELNGKIIWAPNGFRTGVGPRASHNLLGTLKRQHLSCFLGWLDNAASFNNERNNLSQVLLAWKKSKRKRAKTLWVWLKKYTSQSKEFISFSKAAIHCKNDLHLLSSDGFSNGYNVSLYSTVMENSIFAPCPAGNSAETIRLYDALELGCIPVMLSHEFMHSKQALGGIGAIPFPILGSWSEFPEFLEKMKLKLETHPQEIEELQRKCVEWWSNYKIFISKKITESIEGLNT